MNTDGCVIWCEISQDIPEDTELIATFAGDAAPGASRRLPPPAAPNSCGGAPSSLPPSSPTPHSPDFDVDKKAAGTQTTE